MVVPRTRSRKDGKETYEGRIEHSSHENVLDYYATLPPFATSKSDTLLTAPHQLSEILSTLEQMGADEMVFLTWSTEIEQIDRIADLLG